MNSVLVQKYVYFLFYISGHHQITEIILKLSSIHGIFQARVLEWGAIAPLVMSIVTLTESPHFSVISTSAIFKVIIDFMPLGWLLHHID